MVPEVADYFVEQFRRKSMGHFRELVVQLEKELYRSFADTVAAEFWILGSLLVCISRIQSLIHLETAADSAKISSITVTVRRVTMWHSDTQCFPQRAAISRIPLHSHHANACISYRYQSIGRRPLSWHKTTGLEGFGYGISLLCRNGIRSA